MEQMFQYFQQLTKQNNPTSEPQSTYLRVAEKLTYQNYTKWCKLIQIAIERRERLNHIIDAPPELTTSNYLQWKRDSVVLSWIIANIDSDLVNQFLDYTTAWDLWKGIETLLSSGRDELQIFDLSSKTTSLKQNNNSLKCIMENLIHCGRKSIVGCQIQWSVLRTSHSLIHLSRDRGSINSWLA